jgi:hypothetical protein
MNSIIKFVTLRLETFCANIFVPKNFKPKTQLCSFWHQNTGAKCARIMLMKSTPGQTTQTFITLDRGRQIQVNRVIISNFYPSNLFTFMNFKQIFFNNLLKL